MLINESVWINRYTDGQSDMSDVTQALARRLLYPIPGFASAL